MIKERRLRWLGHAARRSDNNMVKQLLFATRIPGHVQPVGRPCGTWMHYAMRDVKDMGQQMGYRSLEWNWPKEAMNKPIWAGIVGGGLNLLTNFIKCKPHHRVCVHCMCVHCMCALRVQQRTRLLSFKRSSSVVSGLLLIYIINQVIIILA